MNFIKEVITSPFDIRDYKIACDQEETFPEEFQLEVLPKVKNQGSMPTCVAHAASSVIEYFHEKENKTRRIFSTEFIYGFRDATYFIGDGMRIRDALTTMRNYGVPFDSICPGNHDVNDAMAVVEANLLDYIESAAPHKIDCYYRCYNETEMKTALMTHGPLLVSMNVYTDGKLVKDIYQYSSNAIRGRHCVMIYGWDKNGWLIQNSWGKSWGEDGRFTLPYDFKLNEIWGIADKADPTSIVYPSKLKLMFYKIWNYFGNLFLRMKNSENT